ncbi:MAG: hypothetical protein K2G51_10650, partial [Lachnospiraceae bacterium]|nr:hypothetical protein [Lachnospiraceae bacterium]
MKERLFLNSICETMNFAILYIDFAVLNTNVFWCDIFYLYMRETARGKIYDTDRRKICAESISGVVR